jgi:hypothetical protein
MPPSRLVCLNEIWRLARQKWETAGRPDGDSSRFWQQAEQELLLAKGVKLGENIEGVDGGR